MANKRIIKITCVLANWCPHCNPTTTDVLAKFKKELNVPVIILDIDDFDQEKIADDIVQKYGDWSSDYLIPQVFFEYSDGEVQHIFTGFSEGVSVTRKAWDSLLDSSFYKELLEQVN